MRHFDYIIAGGGCSGRSLAVRMLPYLKHSNKQVLLVDNSPKKDNDKTWCFWEENPDIFESVVCKSWSRMSFSSSLFNQEFNIQPYQYKMIRAGDFYSYTDDQLTRSHQVSHMRGNIENLYTEKGKACVLIDGETFSSDYAFSSIPQTQEKKQECYQYLLQHFLGWVIETRDPTFNPNCATLMDFNTTQQEGTSFVYILPLSTNCALVEYTVFSEKELSAESYTNALKEYIQEQLHCEQYIIKAQEYGVIPMSDHPIKRQEDRIIYMGTAGGFTKGSTGYTFRFIQKHTAAIVKQLVEYGNPCISTLYAERFNTYDGIFLHLLNSGRLSGEKIFSTMFQKNSSTQILKFLDNETSVTEELQIFSTLQKTEFAMALLKRASKLMIKNSFFKVCLIVMMLPLCTNAQNAGNVLPENNQVLDTAKQTDLIDIAKSLFHIKPRKIKEQKGKHLYFSILPAGGTVPGGSGRALITSTSAAMYLGPKKTTNLSTATFTPYWNFGSRFGLPIRNNIWLPDNTWLIQGDIRFLVYPQFTWGLGTARTEKEKILLEYKYIRFYQNALKRIRPYLYAGLGYNLDYHFHIQPEDASIDLGNYSGYRYGTSSNSVSSGISLNLVYDTRNNAINPMPGMYGNLVYRINPVFLGSNNTWSSLYLDIRKYISMNPAKPNQQNTLAFWSYFWTALDPKTPYLDLPSTGWDPYNRSARGIDQNRYRGRSLFYLESEYRRDITSNGLLGFVVFTNVNTISGSKGLFTSWRPAAGTGLRVKFNKGSNTNIGIDYGMSKAYRSVMFNLGEAF
jgi:hypothetical protein